VLTGPAGRRQSRQCRSVHRPQAETSIWCSPVHGSRAPTEHPNPNIVIVWMSFVDTRTESHGPEPSSRQTGVRRRRSQPGTCRLACANRGSRAPTDHPWIIDDARATASYCRMGLMPQTAELACVIGVPGRLTAQPLHSVRQGASSALSATCQHNNRPSDISQAETTAPTRRPRERHAVQARTGPSTGSDLVGPARVRTRQIAARCLLSARRRLNARLAARRGRLERDFAVFQTAIDVIHPASRINPGKETFTIPMMAA
jgi:hypothetical protein